MNLKLSSWILLVSFSLPISVGKAEKDAAPKENTNHETSKDASANAAPAAPSVSTRSEECLVSEEVIQDLEKREKKLKESESALAEKEKEIQALQTAIKEEMAKLEVTRTEIQGIRAKEIAGNEEKVNKLIETFEGMSPKSAAAVIGGIDDDLAVTALSRLSTVKAGKILGSLNPEKSAKLSELMAYGKGKEKPRGDSTERAPAAIKR